MLEKEKTPEWGVEIFDGYPHNPEVFMSHRNASLTPTGQLRLVRDRCGEDERAHLLTIS